MKFKLFLFVCFPFFLFSQEEKSTVTDSISEHLIKIEGDSLFTNQIELKEVELLPKLKFKDNLARRRYLILRRKTLKVYPYANLAAERLQTLNERLKLLKRNSDKKAYSRKIQKYIEEEFSAELKKLTRTEGQILVKLIHRQTGTTTFELIKNLRNGWRAFWYNSTASMFNISLKEAYNPLKNEEDYLIEDILLRNFEISKIEGLKTALDFDFFEAHKKWSKKKPNESTK
ncbi:DUF4294 domain-containing protein [Aurantibacter sp.]|uniref:DUF4294 domain-containing protein n=1 Tax=Aurantibacter sp. TaxID=2807103 RepID=UPI0035C7D7A8